MTAPSTESTGIAPAAPAPALLASVDTAESLRAALLALLVPSGSRRPALAWQVETAGSPDAQALRDEVDALPRQARLPWFERLLVRLAGHPISERQRLLEGSRKVMNARGAARPIDTLHWLVMRQRLGERSASENVRAAGYSYSQLPEEDVHAIGRYSAFLARLVPVSTVQGKGDANWYADVMKPWQERAWVPPSNPPPDGDALVLALRTLQALPWMQRPAIVRNWVSSALAHSPQGQLAPDAADALRMSCTLLDSPMPPELAATYIDPPIT